jgi:hypothetical protein
MSKYKIPVNGGSDHTSQSSAQEGGSESAENGADEFTTKAATVGVVLVGAALLDAALIPGIVLGAAAIVAPRFFPKLGERLQPLFHSTVRGAYKLGRKARSAVGEVQEHMSDIAAEVHAEEAGHGAEDSAHNAAAGAKTGAAQAKSAGAKA